MFGLPVLAAYAVVPAKWRLAAVAGLAAVALWQPPVLLADLKAAGDRTASPSYFAPLLDELARRPAGRVEIPPTYNYWEAAHAARQVPLARGWLRQVDLARNPMFFYEPLTADGYERWLRDNGVSYVAVADTRPSWVGRKEVELIRAGLPFLTEVWRGPQWTLYEVAGRPSIVEGATLVSVDGARVTLDAPAAGEVLVRVRWSRWLTVNGGAVLSEAAESWTRLRVPAPGRYTVTS